MIPNARIISYSRATGADPAGGVRLSAVSVAVPLPAMSAELSVDRVASLEAQGVKASRRVMVMDAAIAGTLKAVPAIGDRITLKEGLTGVTRTVAVVQARAPIAQMAGAHAAWDLMCVEVV